MGSSHNNCAFTCYILGSKRIIGATAILMSVSCSFDGRKGSHRFFKLLLILLYFLFRFVASLVASHDAIIDIIHLVKQRLFVILIEAKDFK